MKKTIIIMAIVSAMLSLFTSCEDKLEVQEVQPVEIEHDFSVITLPLQKKIKVCETVEIHFQLVRTDKYDGANYHFNFFQPEGKGYIQNDNKDILKPNVQYVVTNETFSLFYTSYCLDLQTIDFNIIDNFNQTHKISVSFELNKNDPFPLLVKKHY
jgi:hypothetical protein